jgi:hypothetical protein
MKDAIFVFGSNLAGRHGKGAALFAKQHRGAKQGKGFGFSGSSYAIPTKDKNLKTLPLEKIDNYIGAFCEFARIRPLLDFELTPIGTGLAGVPKKEIAKLFHKHGLPRNVYLTSTWIYEEKS